MNSAAVKQFNGISYEIAPDIINLMSGIHQHSAVICLRQNVHQSWNVITSKVLRTAKCVYLNMKWCFANETRSISQHWMGEGWKVKGLRNPKRVLNLESLFFKFLLAFRGRSWMTQTGRNVVGWNGPMTDASFIISLTLTLFLAWNSTVTAAGSKPEIVSLWDDTMAWTQILIVRMTSMKEGPKIG